MDEGCSSLPWAPRIPGGETVLKRNQPEQHDEKGNNAQHGFLQHKQKLINTWIWSAFTYFTVMNALLWLLRLHPEWHCYLYSTRAKVCRRLTVRPTDRTPSSPLYSAIILLTLQLNWFLPACEQTISSWTCAMTITVLYLISFLLIPY